jgi:hypothetical protein
LWSKANSTNLLSEVVGPGFISSAHKIALVSKIIKATTIIKLVLFREAKIVRKKIFCIKVAFDYYFLKK